MNNYSKLNPLFIRLHQILKVYSEILGKYLNLMIYSKYQMAYDFVSK